ncbi:MAG: UDP-glucose--hexose-1-phosphate uridylyltransferase [Clostridia bacterium]
MITKAVNELVEYATFHLGLDKKDVVYVRNMLLDSLNLSDCYEGEIDSEKIKNMTVPDEILNSIAEYVKENAIVDELLIPNFLAKLMGLATPSPSAVERTFAEKYKADKKSATDYLYDLSIKNNYIQKTAVDKNLWWQADYKQGSSLEITINLSKPEKNNKDIAKLLTQKSTNYPKCALCYENVGFAGNLTKAARQNLRTIDLKLGGEEWFMQYSPYVYYDEHCIVINKEHHPMAVTSGTFEKLMEFVDIFPQYFVGSNACLPIVGGSILNHEHYQGGKHLMPLHYSAPRKFFVDKKYPDTEISILEWYNSCVRIESENEQHVIEEAKKLWATFEGYTDESVGIFAETNGEKHNAVTPIARRCGKKYIIEIILRNNITSEEHPDGVFHAHTEYHDVKSEGIGLIEAMGLFILPPRLLKSMENEPNKYTKEYINNACQNILKNTAIFKDDEVGQKAFEVLLKKCGYEVK